MRSVSEIRPRGEPSAADFDRWSRASVYARRKGDASPSWAGGRTSTGDWSTVATVVQFWNLFRALSNVGRSFCPCWNEWGVVCIEECPSKKVARKQHRG